MGRLRVGVLAVALVLFGACTRAPLTDARFALKPVSAPRLGDDLPIEPLLAALDRQIAFLQKTAAFPVFKFGERSFTKAEYLAGLERFVAILRGTPELADALKLIEREFQFYEVYGRDHAGEAFMTSYYEPVIPGALKRTDRLTCPLYRAPKEIVALDLALYDDKYAADRKLRGRLVDGKLLPYYTREQIDSQGALKGRGLELVWLDPIDAFILHIQGSGTIDLGRGKHMRVSYTQKNGQRYEAISQFLKDVIPADQMNLHSIEAHLRSLPAEQAQLILNKNPSYIFFDRVTENAPTYLGVPATDGRTIATDAKFFPKGALAFLVNTKPRFEGSTGFVPAGWDSFSRFVLDQDVGGAILGGGRLDLFWGRGDEAKRYAGLIKNTGKLYYVAPR